MFDLVPEKELIRRILEKLNDINAKAFFTAFELNVVKELVEKRNDDLLRNEFSRGE